MASWPTNWKTRTLTALGVTATPEALKIISAWQKSTPLDPWTNNPLGMPAKLGKTASVPGTQYAMFRSISDFYKVLSSFSKTPHGRSVVSELTGNAQPGPAWRAIAALDWPAAATETDWPAAVLDLAGEAYAASVDATPRARRRSAGKPRAAPAVHEAMRQQAHSIVQASAAFSDAKTAVRHLIGRHARYGK